MEEVRRENLEAREKNKQQIVSNEESLQSAKANHLQYSRHQTIFISIYRKVIIKHHRWRKNVYNF